MLKYKNILFSVLVIILLNSSCALPLALLGFYTDGSSNIEETRVPDWYIENPPDEYNIGILMDGRDEEEVTYIYAGEYNGVRIIVPEGLKAENITLKTTAGTIERTEDPTLFRLFIKEPNIAVEITAEDSETDSYGILIGETVNFPLPEPCLNLEENGEMTAETFKKQGQLMLKITSSIPVLCLCNGFNLTRISSDAKRESVKNNTDAFEGPVKVLIAKAVKGDIYIFEEILVNCPGFTESKKARSLVYILQ
jgi:hypothetical protein